MMQTESAMPPAEVARVSQVALSPTQKQIVDKMLARTDTTSRPSATSSEETTGATVVKLPLRDTGQAQGQSAPRDTARVNRHAPGWPDSPQVQTLASIVAEVLADTDDIPPEEDFTTMLLQKLEEAGLDTSRPIVDFYA